MPAPPVNAKKFFAHHGRLATRAAFALMRLGVPRIGELATDWRPLQRVTRWNGGPKEIDDPRRAPLPFNYKPARAGGYFVEGCCVLCGFEIFKNGHWRDVGKKHPIQSTHACCRTIYEQIVMPVYDLPIARRQNFICAETGESLVVEADVGQRGPLGPGKFLRCELDHIVPLWKVRLEWQKYRWPDVLRFWTDANLQALSIEGHKRKTKREAAERARMKAAAKEELCLLLESTPG